jgi:hypothetical protein
MECVKDEIERKANEAVDQYEDRYQLDGLMPVGSFKLPEAVASFSHQVPTSLKARLRLSPR